MEKISSTDRFASEAVVVFCQAPCPYLRAELTRQPPLAGEHALYRDYTFSRDSGCNATTTTHHPRLICSYYTYNWTPWSCTLAHDTPFNSPFLPFYFRICREHEEEKSIPRFCSRYVEPVALGVFIDEKGETIPPRATFSRRLLTEHETGCAFSRLLSRFSRLSPFLSAPSTNGTACFSKLLAEGSTRRVRELRSWFFSYDISIF